jgi:hypothetical protein
VEVSCFDEYRELMRKEDWVEVNNGGNKKWVRDEIVEFVQCFVYSSVEKELKINGIKKSIKNEMKNGGLVMTWHSCHVVM